MANRKRNFGINIRVTPEEKEKIERNARKCRLSVSEYLRQIAMKKQPKELPSEEMIQSLMRLRNVISHFEQRARSASDEEQHRFFMSCAEYIRMIMTDTLQLMSHSKPKAEVKNGND